MIQLGRLVSGTLRPMPFNQNKISNVYNETGPLPYDENRFFLIKGINKQYHTADET